MVEYKLKLFNKWSMDDVKVQDPGLRRCIGLKPVLLPHSGGRHEHERFRKAEVPIVERLVNHLMKPGRNQGKKQLTISIVKQALEIVSLKTKQNPIQVLVNAIENVAPREETTRIAYGGIVYHVSVDVSPQRRVDLALRWITEGARLASFSNPKSIEECLAEEIILASEKSPKSYALSKKDEVERIAMTSR